MSVVPDLTIEVLSPGDLAYEVAQRVADYFFAGVKEVWVFNPKVRVILIRKLDGLPQELHANDTLKSDLLPGFALQVREIFQ